VRADPLAAWELSVALPFYRHVRPYLNLASWRRRLSRLRRRLGPGCVGAPFPPAAATDAELRELATLRVYARWLDDLEPSLVDLVSRFRDRWYHLLALGQRVGPAARELMDQCPALGFALASLWCFQARPVQRPLRAARRLVARRRREIAVALGFPPQAVGLLTRITAGDVSVKLLLDLRGLARDPRLLRRLWFASPTPAVVTILRFAADLVDDRFLADIAPASRRRAYELVAQLQRAVELAAPRRIGPFASAAQLQSQLGELSLAALADCRDLCFGPPPIAGTTEIQPLTSSRDLLAEALSQRFCLASDPRYAGEVAAGRMYVYRVVSAAGRATVAIVRRHGRWVVSELRARANRPVIPAVEALVARWLAAAQGQASTPDRDP
jgi:hypothetical protein